MFPPPWGLHLARPVLWECLPSVGVGLTVPRAQQHALPPRVSVPRARHGPKHVAGTRSISIPQARGREAFASSPVAGAEIRTNLGRAAGSKTKPCVSRPVSCAVSEATSPV